MIVFTQIPKTKLHFILNIFSVYAQEECKSKQDIEVLYEMTQEHLNMVPLNEQVLIIIGRIGNDIIPGIKQSLMRI